MQPTERRIFFILILIAGLAWIFFSIDNTGTSTTEAISAAQKGFLAPNFILKTTDQQTVTLSELKGQAVLVNIWATWCPPCRAEMPAIEKLYLEYKDQGFVVLGLNSTNQDDQTAIIPFIKEYNLTFPILLDELGEVSRTYQIHSLPTSYFINRDGTINEVVIGGPMSEALLRTRIEDILQ
jgi:cytochrome c biogenesis protein CcmG, thiol:disulfide interchange protein DsbE